MKRFKKVKNTTNLIFLDFLHDKLKKKLNDLYGKKQKTTKKLIS